MNNMQPREKILAGIVAGLIVLVAANFLWQRVADMFSTRQARLESLEETHRDRQFEITVGADAAGRLAGWEARSLPADRQAARSAYQSWLTGLVDRVGLQRATVDPARGRAEGNVYYTLPFSIRGRGTLEQAVRFLYGFYEVDLLHKLREVTFKPIEGSREMDLAFTVEALVLPGAESATLNLQPSNRLALNDLADYAQPITSRNLFAEYVPPPPPRQAETPRPRPDPTPPTPPPPPSFDASRFAVLSAVLTVDGQPEAWLQVRTTGDRMRLVVGDDFEIGPVRGRVRRIGVHEVLIEREGKFWRLPIGKSLAELIPLDDEISSASR